MASEETNESAKEQDSLDEENASGENVSTWFSGWYDSAKKKIAETNEFMKHDLQEFSQAFQSDASKLVAATANTMKEKLNINVDLEEASAATRVVKDSLSNFLGNIASKVGPMHPVDDDNSDESAIVGTNSGTRVLSPSEARLYSLRTNPATFCNEPDNENDFHSWLPSFNLEENKIEISSLLLDCSQIRSLYTKLVPTAVSHCDFWARYFFKLHQHDKAEERRAMLVKRAHKAQYDDIEWGDDEDDDWVQPKNIPKVLPEEVENPDQSPDKQELQAEKNLSPNDKERASNEEPEILTVVKENNVEPEYSAIVQDNNTIYELKSAEDENVKNREVIAPGTENLLSDQTIDSNFKTSEETSVTEAAKIVSAETALLDNISDIKAPVCDDKNKTTETNNDVCKNVAGKVPSSEESSDDWEKDFDLDMTEDEIQQALEESATADVGEIDEDWDEWE